VTGVIPGGRDQGESAARFFRDDDVNVTIEKIHELQVPSTSGGQDYLFDAPEVRHY